MADVVGSQRVSGIGSAGDGDVVRSPLIAMGDYTVDVGFPFPIAHGEGIACLVRVTGDARCDKVKHRNSPALVSRDNSDATPPPPVIVVAVFDTIGANEPAAASFKFA